MSKAITQRRAMVDGENQTVIYKMKGGSTDLQKDEIPKDSFVRHMKGIVGDHMLTITLTKVQSQTRPNQGAAGQQLPVRMPTVGSGARQLNDPYALAQLHQRSMNAAADQSRIDAKIESQGLQTSQLPSSTSSKETERSSVHIQGLNKQQQQHLHFSSAYGSSASNYNPFITTSTGSLPLNYASPSITT